MSQRITIKETILYDGVMRMNKAVSKPEGRNCSV